MAKKAIQQLDLFASMGAPTTVEKNIQPVAPTTLETKETIYANEKIGVKVKLKKEVQKVAEKKGNYTTKTKNNKQGKRGRKSFKEMDAELGSVNIPDDETLKKKLYYPISEVAVFFNVNTSLIRMWETEFDILQPRKNKKGDRLFRFEDIKNLQIIYYLLRNRKFSLDGAKKYLKENKGTLDSEQQLVQSLKKIRKFLIDIKTDLQA